MGKCVKHTDRETSFLCSKHIAYMCEECLQCRDPKLYCKFRTSCPIWFMQKTKENFDKERNIEEVNMPIYEYKCEKCNHLFERLVFKGDKKDINCPKCGDSKKVKKLISSGSFMSGSGAGACGPSASRGFS